MRLRHVLGALVLVLLVAAAPAAAGVRIGGVDTSRYPEIGVTVVTGSASGEPRLEEDGRPVVGLTAANLGRAKSVVLAIDRSQSMQGRPLLDATAAARQFVASKGAADRIQVVAFGHDAIALTRFSSAATDADAALAGLRSDNRSGTALWDAVVRAAATLRYEDEPGHVILLVTDGRDVSSTASLNQAIAAAQRARAAVYAIGIEGRDFTPAPLRDLANATGGSYREASSTAQLAALYRSIGRSLANTWQLRYVTAARPGDRLRLAVGVRGATTQRIVQLSGGGASRAPVASQPSVLPRSVWLSKSAPEVLGLMVALLVLAAAGFAISGRKGGWLTARLAAHVGTPPRRRPRKHRGNGRPVLRAVFAATERALANVKQFRGLQRLLVRADLPLLAAELLYVSIGAAIFGAIFLAVVGVPGLLVMLFMLGFGSVPIAWVGWKARKRMKAFDNQLPDILITVAASLKAGHSFRHAIQAVVDEGAEPAAKEFRRVLTETRLGRPMDEALAEMSERIGSKNLSFVLTAVTIQRQIGGSLAGLFDMVAETVRQRQQFARKIRSLTAMGRMSAYVLGALPFGLALLITVINPTYMTPLWHTSTGHLLVGMGLGMLAIGSFVLKKMVSFKG